MGERRAFPRRCFKNARTRGKPNTELLGATPALSARLDFVPAVVEFHVKDLHLYPGAGNTLKDKNLLFSKLENMDITDGVQGSASLVWH